MMVPQVYLNGLWNAYLNKSLQQYKYEADNDYGDDFINFIFLRKNSYINNVNEIEMDAILENEQGNVSLLKSEKFNRNDSKAQDDIVIQEIAGLGENWWSLCGMPVFIVLIAIIGVLAIAFVLLLWLKSQMIQREKNKKIVALDSSQIQLNSNSCTCPSPSLPPNDRWIYHTVINLKSSNPTSCPVIVEGQCPDNNQRDNFRENTLENVLVEKKDVTDKKEDSNKIKGKGLLERRGSNASLTIDLPQSACIGGKTSVVTPTRECMTEEFLLSAGNVLSRLQLKNCLKNVQSLHQEFWEIPLNHPEKSVVTGCGTKNRYQSILPNERTRVKLNQEEQSLDAYINANYIRGYEGEEKAYIATQGPLPNTVEDLYKMAWNEKSPIIVMITKFFEKTKVKCESYFPTELNETAEYGDFRVTVLSVEKKDGFSVRELSIENESKNRKILHYWYDSWPDHKTPQNAQSIVSMATEIEKFRVEYRAKTLNNKDGITYGPIIVHCSAGIGRTGCFIAISLAICQLLEEDKVDILGIVCQMRCDRGGMIQTAEQYEFVHRAIALFEHSLPNPKSE